MFNVKHLTAICGRGLSSCRSSTDVLSRFYWVRFGFVDFDNEADCKAAKEAMDDGEIDGSKVTLDYAKPKGDGGFRGGRGGGFGGRGGGFGGRGGGFGGRGGGFGGRGGGFGGRGGGFGGRGGGGRGRGGPRGGGRGRGGFGGI